MARTVAYQEVVAIKAFLGYLRSNYSKLINPNDKYLIAAVAAWFYQESGGYKRVIGNNPFNIRPGMLSFMASGVRVSTRGNGKFLIFPSLSVGFRAAAYLLIHGNKAYGYRVALAAMRKGGNNGAVDFLAALAMSSWDAAHYGARNWADAYNPHRNHLLRNYQGITGLQVGNPGPGPRPKGGSGGRPSPRPQPKAKKKKRARPIPRIPRDFNFQAVVRSYLDPWAARTFYRKRGRDRTIDDNDRFE